MFKKLIEFFRRKKPTSKDLLLEDMERFLSMNMRETRWITSPAVTVSSGTAGPLILTTGNIMDSGTPVGEPESSDNRIEVNPKEIIAEFEQAVDVNLEDLQKKLDLAYERADLYKNTLRAPIPDDIRHAICVLEARKNYPEVAQWIPWKTTTKEKIDALCKKYKLSHRSTSDFIPELPRKAVEEITAYKKVHEAAFAHEPKVKTLVTLSIIAPTKMFRERKGDPILLAKSPFGDFFYVLCAWDEEVKFVQELLA